MAALTRMASGEISPKAIAAALVATVTPYILVLITQYEATGVVDAADWRKLVVGLVTGGLTFLGAWLARPGRVVTVLDPEEAERFGIFGPDEPHV